MERTNHKNQGFNILCLDPSLSAFGWVVIKETWVEDRGCIKTVPAKKKSRIRKGDDRCRRITEINTELLRVIRQYKISYIISEQPHGSQSAVAATALGILIGLIQTLADTLDIGLEWYNEADSKKCALGKVSATKEEMVVAMNKLYVVDWFHVGYKDEAVADALAIYHVASKNSAVLKMMRYGK
jgi:Holliday junction resolvasome RuvABC endonuclease subunit